MVVVWGEWRWTARSPGARMAPQREAFDVGLGGVRVGAGWLSWYVWANFAPLLQVCSRVKWRTPCAARVPMDPI